MGRMVFRLAGLAGVSLLLANCATVTRGTTNEVKFESEPPQATVTLSTGQSCTTPCSFTIPRNQGFTAAFTKDDYVPVTIPVVTQVQGGGAAGLAGNIILGGVVGVVADAASGASLDHTPNPVRAILERAARQPRAGRPSAGSGSGMTLQRRPAPTS